MTYMITGKKHDPDEKIPNLSGRVARLSLTEVGSAYWRSRHCPYVYLITANPAGIGFGITVHIL